jgi:16S rRNA (cytosine1402-N4)-methyltransferase
MTIHISVLRGEAIELLNLKEGDTVIDATLGGGGHSTEILNLIGKTGTLIALDMDTEAIERFKKKAETRYPERTIHLIHDNFAHLKDILERLEITKVNAILADLGWSSDQVEDADRGMSFLQDAELDMRLDRTRGITAKDIVNNSSQEELETIIRKYGEERFARSIARNIVRARTEKPIITTHELVKIIQNSVPQRNQYSRIHFATRTFQSLRIAVNQELENLERFIPQAIDALLPGGRLAIISFHSLEDRIVKHRLRENAGGCICSPATQLEALQKELQSAIEHDDAKARELEEALQAGKPQVQQCICGRRPIVKIITKKPVAPGLQEAKENPRARSAKLRVCEKV